MQHSYISKRSFKLSWCLWSGFLAIFLLAGVLGHDPWKQDETYSFGIINHFFSGGYWVVPENAGTPFMEKPPLYYWTAALLCKVMNGMLPMPDCARLASVLYMLVAMLFVWKSAMVIYKESKDAAWAGLLLFMGSIGIVRHCHDMFTDVALLAGCAMVFYAMALLACRNEYWKTAGMWLGLGMGIAFLTKGFFMPIVLTTSAFCLLILRSEVRTLRTVYATGLAFGVAAPFLFIWPAFLYHYSPALFMQWFWENNVGRFLGFSVEKLGADNKPYFILFSVLWFAFPAFPLAVLAAWPARRDWKQPGILLPLAISLVGLVLLSFSASARSLYLLPLIPMLALLAVRGLHTLPEKCLQYWNRVVVTIGVVSLIGLWLIWISLLPGHPLPLLLPYVGKIFPVDFVPPHTQWLAIITAMFSSGFFLYVICSSRRRSGAMAPPEGVSVSEGGDVLASLQINTTSIWFVTVATGWIVANTLLLPWTDETKSYRPVIAQMGGFIRNSEYKDACMNEYFLGESIAPMLEYFDKEHTLAIVNGFDVATCPLMMTVTGRNESVDSFPGWKLLWKGSRALDAKDEELRLYARNQ